MVKFAKADEIYNTPFLYLRHYPFSANFSYIGLDTLKVNF